MRIGRSKILFRTHTALTLYLYFIATALPSASYDATAASPPPPPPLLAASTRRKRRGRGFGGGTRWRAGRGPIGRLACACWSAPPPTSLSTVRRRRRRRRRVCGGMSLRSGRRTERDKKSKKNVFALYGRLPVIQTQQPTKNTRTRRRR